MRQYTSSINHRYRHYSKILLSSIIIIIVFAATGVDATDHLKRNGGGAGQTPFPSPSNPYIPISKNINLLLLRNGMPKMAGNNHQGLPPPPPPPSNGGGRFTGRNHHHPPIINIPPNQHHQGPPRPPVFHAPPPSPMNNRMQIMSAGPPQPPPPPPPPPPMESTDYDQNNEIVSGQQENHWSQQHQDQGNDQPRITHLDVKCDRNYMKVSIYFDKPFNGVIFSKGHYQYRNCIYLSPNSGVKKLFFDISINSCGTTGNAQGTYYNEDVTADSGLFFENTIIVQYDPEVQEAWDQARRLRCTWHDQYEKSVSFRPFPVDMLDVVRADFAGDNVGCWMQIQVGKGPWASEVAGIVKIGQTMTMVLAIKDEEGKFDMLVRNCIAHDGKRSPIELVDGNGCIVRPKIMTKFTKIKNFGSSASVLSYTHFQAFKFPDSMEVHFQCTIQICRFQCPEQCSKQAGNDIINLYNNDEMDGARRRRKRDTSVQELLVGGIIKKQEKQIGLNKEIQVVSPRDLSFSLESFSNESSSIGHSERLTQIDSVVEWSSMPNNVVCITTFSFVMSLICVALICCACTSMFLMMVKRNQAILERKRKFTATFLNHHVK